MKLNAILCVLVLMVLVAPALVTLVAPAVGNEMDDLQHDFGNIFLIVAVLFVVLCWWNRLNWNGIKAYIYVYRFTIIFGVISAILIGFYIYYEKSWSEIASIAIGLVALIIALISLESSTSQLKEIQTDYWNTRGIDHRKNKEYYDAFQAFDKGIHLDNRSTKCLVNKANALCQKGKRFGDESSLEEALKTIDYAISIGPKYPPAILTRKTQREKPIQENQEEMAIQGYANALKSKCDILIHLADLREKHAGEQIDELRNEALHTIEKAIATYPPNNPQLPGAYATKGTALYKLSKYDDAIEACDKAVKLGRYEALGWAIKGNALESKGNHWAAIKDFNKAIELKPDSSVFWYSKGQSIRALGDNLLALHAYDKAIEFDKLDSDAWNQRGMAMFDLGCKSLNSLESQNIKNIFSNGELFWLNTDSSVYGEFNYYLNNALNSFDRAIDINPNDSMFWVNKGRVLSELGRTTEANEAYAKARELGSSG